MAQRLRDQSAVRLRSNSRQALRPRADRGSKGTSMVRKRNVEFEAEGGVRLRGWLFTPEGREPRPAITMAHGYAGVKEHGLERFAMAFAEAGFVVLIHDHRNFGPSDGEN